MKRLLGRRVDSEDPCSFSFQRGRGRPGPGVSGLRKEASHGDPLRCRAEPEQDARPRACVC
jgi:hypothetical protein